MLENLSEISNTEIYELINKFKLKIPDESLKQIISSRKEIFEEGKLASLTCNESGINFITSKNPDFPSKLIDIKDHPRWIFYKGDLERVNDKPIASIIGTRDYTKLGKDLTIKLTEILVSSGVTTLSGLARGIDYFSHETTLKKKGKNIAVIAHGLIGDYKTYPKEIEDKIINQHGLIISEYLPFQHPHKSHFLRRNELVAALSDYVFPTEMPDLQSGTGSTVRRALSMNKKIIAISPESNSDSIQKTYQNLMQMGALKIQFSKSSIFRTLLERELSFQSKEDYVRALQKYYDYVINNRTEIYDLGSEVDHFKKFLDHYLDNYD